MLSCLLHSLISLILVGTRGYRACLYFSFLDLSLWAHEEIVLALIFCFWIDLRGHTRVSCLPLFIYFPDRYSFYDALDRSFPVGTREWRVCPSSTLWVGWPVPLFSRTGQLLLYCQHTKSQVMKSLSHLYCKIALVLFWCWTLVLFLCRYSWTIGLINLVNLDVVST